MEQMRLSKKVYLQAKKNVLNQYAMKEEAFNRLLKQEYNEAAGVIMTSGMAKAIAAYTGGPTIQLDEGELMDDFDMCYFYKRNVHVILPEMKDIDISEGVDTTLLNELNTDLDIDTIYKGKTLYIKLAHRNFPIHTEHVKLEWAFQIWSDGVCINDMTAEIPVAENVKKVYMFRSKHCETCGKCKKFEFQQNQLHLRPRYREGCQIDAFFANPLELLSIAMHVVKVYVNREKISRQRKDNADARAIRSLMVAKEEHGDTERVMSMYEYAKEYRESEPYTWKGGHHASPVSHPRSGYYRKARHGTHVIKDGQFEFVGKGLGNFIYVKPTLVNAHKDDVVAEMV